MLVITVMEIHCSVHHTLFKLPTTDEEFSSGGLHGEVEKCQAHILESPDCRLEKVPSEEGDN